MMFVKLRDMIDWHQQLSNMNKVTSPKDAASNFLVDIHGQPPSPIVLILYFAASCLIL